MPRRVRLRRISPLWLLPTIAVSAVAAGGQSEVFYVDHKLNRAIFTGLWRGGKRLADAYQIRRAQKRDSQA